MSFLHPDVLPEPMRLIVRCLMGLKKPIPQDELVRLIAPNGLSEALASATWTGVPEAKGQAGKLIVELSLAEMRKAGLVEIGPTKQDTPVSLGDAITSAFPNARAVRADSFSAFLRESVLPGRCQSMGESGPDDSTAADLGIVLALALWVDDPLTPLDGFDAKSERTLKAIQSHQLGGNRSDWFLTNNEQYQPFIAWSIYLGFAVSEGGGQIMVDPTEALQHALAGILEDDEPIGAVLERLGETLPSTDRGIWGRRVASSLEIDPTATVSPGVALGLARLEHSGAISMTNKSDAESLALPVDPRRQRRISHVSRGKSL